MARKRNGRTLTAVLLCPLNYLWLGEKPVWMGKALTSLLLSFATLAKPFSEKLGA